MRRELDAAARKVRDELEGKLRQISDSGDFVYAAIDDAGTVENWKKVIDFIDRNSDQADHDSVAIYAFLLKDMDEELSRTVDAPTMKEVLRYIAKGFWVQVNRTKDGFLVEPVGREPPREPRRKKQNNGE